MSECPADKVSFNVEGRLIFFPKTSWCGLKPLTFIKEFFALRAQARAVSHEQLMSSLTLRIMSVKMALCLSQIPFDHGDSAGVVETFILKFSQKSINSREKNSPPLSLNTLNGVPKRLTQF